MICPKCKHDFIPNSKTTQQNKYIHAIIGEIAREYGYTLNEMKHLLKWKFGYCNYIQEVAIYDSIADMSKEQLSQFTEQCIQHAAEEGIIILSPEEYFSQTKNLNKHDTGN